MEVPTKSGCWAIIVRDGKTTIYYEGEIYKSGVLKLGRI